MTEIELYRCSDCHKVFTDMGACHGHIEGHFGLLESLKNLISPDIDHLMGKTEKIVVKDFKVVEEVK